MNLYRFEVTTTTQLIYVVVAAHNDEQAFQLAENELDKQLIPARELIDISLYEKKKIQRGGGFVVYAKPLTERAK
ncbi:DUF3906 family protein [Thermolongibacillus altinsuensis]|uniref:DUF3906 family protein n=1 Tax=Thermolongibacillus altinsuensis TaxID=575256 RepID=UPI001043CB6B|nr:DUF3906 family protein [Thermolongibacillus altinsuensis]GMB09262.1 hypothetical protein B1no1_19720 [Thermolongibacillus altinsuensis]